MLPDFSSTIKSYFDQSDVFPTGYNGPALPGASIQTASGNDGTIVLQKLAAGELNIELGSFHFSRRMKVPFSPDKALLNSVVSLKSKFLFRSKDIKSMFLSEGSFVFFHDAGKPYEAIFEKEKDYVLFNIRYSQETINEIIPCFPPLFNSFFIKLKAGKAFAFERPERMPFTVKKITNEILYSSYMGKPMEYFFDLKVKESLFMLLIKQNNRINKAFAPSAEESEKLKAIADLLLTHFDTRYPLSELARKTQMNENKLQLFFQKLFGKTIYNYQRDAKLEKSKSLIQDQHTSVKYAALTVGYKSITAFETEFKKYFGYTPGSLLKRKL